MLVSYTLPTMKYPNKLNLKKNSFKQTLALPHGFILFYYSTTIVYPILEDSVTKTQDDLLTELPTEL